MSDEMSAPTRLGVLPEILNETTKYAAATALVAIYVCGYLITTLSNAKYGFYDTELLRPKIMTAGFVFMIAVSYPFYLQSISLNAVKSLITKSIGSAFFDKARIFMSYLVLINTLFAVSAFFTSLLFEPQYQSAHPWKLVIWSVSILLVWLITCIVESNVNTDRKLAKIITTAAIICCGCAALYILNLAVFWSLRSFQYLWPYAIITGSSIDLNFDIRNIDRLRKYPWFFTFYQFLAVLLIFAHFVYPKLKPLWGGALEEVSITFQQSAGSGQQPMKVQLIDASAEGYYVLLGNRDKATFFPRTAISRIDFK